VKERKLWQYELPEDQIWFYIHEIAQGLAALHNAGFIQGTLKSSNVVLDGSIEPCTTVKLTDMIIRPANLVHWHNSSHLRYLAPEVLSFLATEKPDPTGIDFKAADGTQTGLWRNVWLTLLCSVVFGNGNHGAGHSKETLRWND